MIIKNGQVYYRPRIKKDSTKQSSFLIKNGQVFYNLSFKKLPIVTTVAGYGQKILSITSSNINKFIGVARTAIEKVIGVE